MRNNYSKYVISSIINSSTDRRFYAKVHFSNFTEYGLLDTGANISCIGSDLANVDFSPFPQFVPTESCVKKADGKVQKTIGFLSVEVTFREAVRKINFLIVQLAPDLFTDALICDFFGKLDVLNRLPVLNIVQSPNNAIENIYDLYEMDNEKYTLTLTQQRQLQSIIELFPNFSKQGLGRTSLIKHDINVGEAKPIKQRFYPVSPAVEKLMYQEIDRMLALGVIEPSLSPWSSPMRLVVKPNKVRLCLDARRVNHVTKKDAYPLPSIERIFARLPKANIISKLDLKDAYWQVGLAEEAKPLTAFTVPGRPLYQFVVMPFGLCTAPQTMCRLMDQLIPADLRHCVFGYLDDLVIVSEDFSSHLSVLARIAGEF